MPSLQRACTLRMPKALKACVELALIAADPLLTMNFVYVRVPHADLLRHHLATWQDHFGLICPPMTLLVPCAGVLQEPA